MAKKKHHHEEHVDETWLIPYADLLTLLLALFIVLFASSSVDAKKFEAIAYSLNNAFNSGSGIMEYPSPVPTEQKSSLPPENQPGLSEDDQENKNKDQEKDTAPETNKDDQKSIEQELQDLLKLQKKINHYITQNKLDLSLQTKLTDRGLMITILDNALFRSGSAEVKPEARSLGLEISQLLYTDPPRQVTIAGHTDDIPINTSQFRSNWDLSAMRSINFMKVLLENKKLEPQRFSATGYGEYRPVTNNNSPAGRAKNRRVEVLILPNYSIKVNQ
jgi:chemotaxis protein MotB